MDDNMDMLDKVFISEAPGDKARKGFRLHRLIPSIMTLTALACGLLSIQKAVAALDDPSQWENAVLLIVVAAVLDSMDGAMARLLRATSRFGAELDSLSDFLCFGVAPAFVTYLWVLNESGRVGWIAVLVFVMASALRLARFNSMSDNDTRPEWARKYFQGVPAPGGAGLALLPMIIYFQIPEFSELRFATPVIGLWMILIALLMVSRVPTFSTKQVKAPTNVIPMLIMATLFIAAMIHAPWPTLTVIGVVYAVLIPIAVRHHAKREKIENAKNAPKNVPGTASHA